MPGTLTPEDLDCLARSASLLSGHPGWMAHALTGALETFLRR